MKREYCQRCGYEIVSIENNDARWWALSVDALRLKGGTARIHCYTDGGGRGHGHKPIELPLDAEGLPVPPVPGWARS